MTAKDREIYLFLRKRMEDQMAQIKEIERLNRKEFEQWLEVPHER